MTKKDKVHKDPTTIGEYLKLNKYVAYFCVVYELMLLPEISNILFMVYGGARPDIVACGNISLTHLSSQTEKCDAMAQIQMDTECEPVLKPQFESVNYEFNYLCVNNSIIKDSISFQMIGLMAGNMLFGQLSDMYGRKKMLQVCTASMIILGFISSFANNLVTFSFARLFVMFFVGGHHSVNYVYMLENLPIRHRMWIMTVITFSPNYIILAIIAYYSHDWRTLSRILSAVAILPLIMSRYLHESPRWLLQRDKINRARHVFHDIETWSTHKAEKLTRREGQLEAVLDNTVKVQSVTY
ncbi:hypothetical protein AB6A40_001166 [Gnathostoma spinigerum]|uniref:Major facilitator superfamily (MFS) profile domain-containing protein n=1 Tax=Gnathostoma spinigerum TaxID=75299 RepID=A0ABD6E5N9_9BILA